MIAMIDLTDGGKTYSHLSDNIESDKRGLIYIKEITVKEYCVKCKNRKMCESRVKKYNNIIFKGMMDEARIKRKWEEVREIQRRKIEVNILREKSLKRLAEIGKIDIPDKIVEPKVVDESKLLAEKIAVDRKKRSLVTRRMVKFIVDHHLCTEDAELVYQSVKRYSTVQPHDIEVKYFTNERGVEERIWEEMEKGQIPTLSITRKEQKKIDEALEVVRKPKVVSESNEARKELVRKIELGEVGVLEA